MNQDIYDSKAVNICEEESLPTEGLVTSSSPQMAFPKTKTGSILSKDTANISTKTPSHSDTSDEEEELGIMEEYASLLESRLAQIRNIHQDTLAEIEAQKEQQMEEIYQESSERSEEDDDDDQVVPSADDLEIIHAAICALHDNNLEFMQQNQELAEEIEEIANENTKLFVQTTQLCRNAAALRVEIEAAEKRQADLLEAEQFLIMCKQEYENAYINLPDEFI